MLPGGGLRRGSITCVDGITGTSAVVLPLLAAATSTGEWGAVVDSSGTFGGLAALEAGVVLERCALIRKAPPERWATVVSALLEGMAIVIATPPRHVRLADARRLLARTRERQALLVVCGAWPAEAALRILVEAGIWHGLERGEGTLTHRDLTIRLEGRRRHGSHARAG